MYHVATKCQVYNQSFITIPLAFSWAGSYHLQYKNVHVHVLAIFQAKTRYSSYSTDSKDQYNLVGPIPIIKNYVSLTFVEIHLFRLVS